MKKLLTLGFFCAAGLSQASIYTYTCAMNGFQEVPQTTSQGIATVVLTMDDTNPNALTLSGTGTVQFLTAAPTGFHIHNAPYGANGQIVQDIGPGAISGSNITFNINFGNNAAGFNSLKSLMDQRLTYMNIHTGNFPSGEIRGQIAPVPEPASMLALGAGALVLIRRRSRK